MKDFNFKLVPYGFIVIHFIALCSIYVISAITMHGINIYAVKDDYFFNTMLFTICPLYTYAIFKHVWFTESDNFLKSRAQGFKTWLYIRRVRKSYIEHVGHAKFPILSYKNYLFNSQTLLLRLNDKSVNIINDTIYSGNEFDNETVISKNIDRVINKYENYILNDAEKIYIAYAKELCMLPEPNRKIIRKYVQAEMDHKIPDVLDHCTEEDIETIIDYVVDNWYICAGTKVFDLTKYTILDYDASTANTDTLEFEDGYIPSLPIEISINVDELKLAYIKNNN